MKNTPSYYALPELKNRGIRLISPSQIIIRAVCSQYNVSFESLKAYCREPDYVFARHLLMFLLRKKANLSFPQIGLIMKRNHATVLKAVQNIQNYIDTDSLGKRAEILSLF